MAEGVSRLNQQVLDNGHWDTSDKVRRSEGGRAFETGTPPMQERLRPRLDTVLRAVETEIIPRLVLNRRQADASAQEAVPVQAEILRFVDLLLAASDDAAAPAFVAALRAQGHSVEYVYLDLFQPAARHIGDLWAADLCGFIDVTLALGTLHRMLRDFSPEFQKEARRFDAGRQALLAPLPGDQHTFGLSMVAEFFRRSAWSVWTEPFESNVELTLALRETWFTVVGFSVSLASQLDRLANVIEIVRRESCNRVVGVLVGGPLFVDHPEYVAQVGADAVGFDARQAVFHAECFAAQMAGR